MSADLYLHIFEGITEQDLACFFATTIVSKWYNEKLGEDYDQWVATYEKIAETPMIWIGEVSWLKAVIFEDLDSYVPQPVQIIHDIVGEDLPVIDDAMIDKIITAFRHPNTTSYTIATPEAVSQWLEDNKGKRVFRVSW